MVIHHFPAMALFAFLVSVVFGTLYKETPREKVLYGIKSFVLFIVIAVALGWIMYPFPRH
jgi:putative Mn2+ efflux pump MntP